MGYSIIYWLNCLFTWHVSITEIIFCIKHEIDKWLALKFVLAIFFMFLPQLQNYTFG